ncbi:hypothetical protein U9M48_012523 [Paspalum notatum var. saurae]|uniref:Uncharacterized protein n=1 Tax=Paspalum notatum var. saurae TaxID=547442 RepID=A0AAQ3SXM1_PASNO
MPVSLLGRAGRKDGPCALGRACASYEAERRRGAVARTADRKKTTARRRRGGSRSPPVLRAPRFVDDRASAAAVGQVFVGPLAGDGHSSEWVYGFVIGGRLWR